MKKKQESGRSMIEMVGVLAVMGLITAGAFVLISSGLKSQKRSGATDEIYTIAANVRSAAAQASDRLTPYSNLPAKTEAAAAGKSYASSMLGSSASVYGATTYYSVHKESSGAKFAVVLWGAPDSECDALAKRAYTDATATCTKAAGNASSSLTIIYDN